ncbi:MAG: 2-amino-4-hydroxy-6-hydroxymethyldihydropteridine diphosphokinase [Woeseiaceae bacterium]
MAVRVFIGLGSNLDEPIQQIKTALDALEQHSDLNLVQYSCLYKSDPMGPQDQPDYINAVAEVTTRLASEPLLNELQTIENTQGRVRKTRWGARTLDLDILLYGNEVIDSERLIVPHCGIAQRNFVIYPLSELVNDDFNIPSLGEIKNLLKQCSSQGIQRLNKA